MGGYPRFWIACRVPDTLSDPLTVDVPGLGEALAVFCFEEEVRLYLGYGDEGLRPCAVGPDDLVALLLGPWSRFERITLDPMPGRGAGIMLRLASTRRGDFLNHVARKYGLGRAWRDGGPPAARRGKHSLGYARPDIGLVGDTPTPE